jgi:hypothetical protein
MTIERIVEIPPSRRLELYLPPDLPAGRVKVALTVTPEKNEPLTKGKSAFGCLRRFANPAKISGEEGVWPRTVIEKHAKS